MILRTNLLKQIVYLSLSCIFLASQFYKDRIFMTSRNNEPNIDYEYSNPLTLDIFTNMFRSINAYIGNLEQDLQVRMRLVTDLSREIIHPENIDSDAFNFYITNLIRILSNNQDQVDSNSDEIYELLTDIMQLLNNEIFEQENNFTSMVAIEVNSNFSIYNLDQKTYPVAELDLSMFNFFSVNEFSF
jgi:hypothetical protein